MYAHVVSRHTCLAKRSSCSRLLSSEQSYIPAPVSQRPLAFVLAVAPLDDLCPTNLYTPTLLLGLLLPYRFPEHLPYGSFNPTTTLRGGLILILRPAFTPPIGPPSPSSWLSSASGLPLLALACPSTPSLCLLSRRVSLDSSCRSYHVHEPPHHLLLLVTMPNAVRSSCSRLVQSNSGPLEYLAPPPQQSLGACRLPSAQKIPRDIADVCGR